MKITIDFTKRQKMHNITDMGLNDAPLGDLKKD